MTIKWSVYQGHRRICPLSIYACLTSLSSINQSLYLPISTTENIHANKVGRTTRQYISTALIVALTKEKHKNIT